MQALLIAGRRRQIHIRIGLDAIALADRLNVVNLVNFPAYGESVYQALIKTARRDIILQSATIAGFDATTPAAN